MYSFKDSQIKDFIKFYTKWMIKMKIVAKGLQAAYFGMIGKRKIKQEKPTTLRPKMN